MHGLRGALLHEQIAALGLPYIKDDILSPCPNAVYEREMAVVLNQAKRDAVRHVIFGDLFWQDIRAAASRSPGACRERNCPWRLMRRWNLRCRGFSFPAENPSLLGHRSLESGQRRYGALRGRRARAKLEPTLQSGCLRGEPARKVESTFR